MAGPWRSAVIGLGSISKAHLSALAQLEAAELVAVVDLDPARAEAAATEYGCTAYTDLATMLSAERPELCAVCVPHGLHLPAAQAALSAGAHVMIEKPMANDAAQCDRILATAAEHDRQVMVGYTWHYRASLRDAKAFLKSTGEPVLYGAAELSYDFPAPGRQPWFFDQAMGGGNLLANGCHAIDWLRWVFDAPAASVAASTHNLPAELPVDSVTAAQIRFAGGGAGQVLVWGLTSLGNRARFEFRTEHYGVSWTGAEGLVAYRHGEPSPLPSEQGEAPFAAQYRAFLEAVAGGAPAPTDGAYGREINAIIDAIRLASETGREEAVGRP